MKSWKNFLFAGICFTSFASDSTKILQPGIPAPTFSLPDLNGDRVALRVYCGDTLLKPGINNVHNIVILSFWATYCKPCQTEIPLLMKFAAKHSADSIKIFCISIDNEGASLVQPFVDTHGYTLPILLDQFKKTAERYHVNSLPSLFVIDGSGFVRFSAVGFNESLPVDEKLEMIVNGIRSGKISDSAVGTAQKSDNSISSQLLRISPKAKWDAVVKVECGMPVDFVAKELGAGADEVQSWDRQIKNAALLMWGNQSVKKNK